MDSARDGSLWGIGPEEQRSVYALVTYIPEPLGKFLDGLRLELMPGCKPHAHVSLLPPRPLDADWHVAAEHARSLLEESGPFEVEFTRPAIFPVTGVIYLEVGAGQDHLLRLHQSLNAGAIAFAEPFPYCPHSTLAQGVGPERVQELYQLAARRWQDFPGPHRFIADHAVFVQNLNGNTWIDLATLWMGRVPAKS
jgi:hypothetical protein